MISLRRLNVRLPSNTAGVNAGLLSDTFRGLPPRLVIAIDFGTYASGYALQWRSDFENDRLKIHCNTKWTSGGFCTYKTPTSLLLKPDKSFAEFGYQAEKRFGELGFEEDGEKQDPRKWYMFRHFKMMLYNRESIDEKSHIEAAYGQHLPALEVFSKSIKYLKDHAISHLIQSGLPYPEAETKWVITVPALWDDPAKTVMRKAAEKAGITSKNLVIALEPECAAIYCSQIPPDQLEIQGDEGKLKYVAAPGSTIMVVDMGGGTVDATTIQVNANTDQHKSISTMSQVHRSGGGLWGGMNVDQKFMQLLKGIVGEEVMQQFSQECPLDEYDLRMDFESRKREVKHQSESNQHDRFQIKLPPSLKGLWEEKEEKSVTEMIKSRPALKDIRFQNGRLSFKTDLIRGYLQETTNNIIEYVEKVLGNPDHKGLLIDSLILVGGFAESNYVVQSIREALQSKGIPVVRPQTTELAVLNGAVLFGQNEEIITSRVMRHTYGVGMIMEFDPLKHSEEKKFEADGKVWANDVFRKHVSRGQDVKLGQWVSDKEYYPVDDNQTSAVIYIYCSDKIDPIHTTEPGCRYIGKLEVDFPITTDGKVGNKSKGKRAVEVAMSFGGTEMNVKAISKTLGKLFKHTLRLQ